MVESIGKRRTAERPAFLPEFEPREQSDRTNMRATTVKYLVSAHYHFWTEIV